MASERQIEANRANARRSTGPKSQRGKARAKMNAVTHGLTAKQIIVPGERPEQFDRLREGLNADFAPGSTIECELVDQLAASLLRRRRVPVVEAALLKRLMGARLDDYLQFLTDEELELLEKISRRVLGLQEAAKVSDVVDRQGANGDRETGIPGRVDMLTVFARYESSLMNEIVKTVKLIHVLQARRIAAEEAVRTVGAASSKERLSAVQDRSSSSQSPLGQRLVGSNGGQPSEP